MNRSLVGVELQRLHSTLAADWSQNEEQIRTTWELLTLEERRQCFLPTKSVPQAWLPPGMTLDHLNLTPEWNNNITESSTQYLLELLESRATRSLYQQAFLPFKGSQSDYSHAVKTLSERDIPQASPNTAFDNTRTLIVGDKQDDAVVDVAYHTTWLRNLTQHAEYDVGLRAVPEKCGWLIHLRQLKFFMSMVLIVCEILERDPEPLQPRPTKSDGLLWINPSSKLFAKPIRFEQPTLASILLPGLIGRALDFVCLTENSSCFRVSNPTDFAALVLRYYTTQSVHVPDSKGRVLPIPTSTGDIFGPPLFDYVNDDNKFLFTWQYIFELLCLLHLRFDDREFRHVVLQQLANVCQMAYRHAQSMLLRELRIGLAGDSFIRTNEVDQAGNFLTVMKQKPERLATRDTFLHCLLCLVRRETSPDNALGLIGLASIRLSDWKSLAPGETTALNKLIHVVSFIGDLSFAFRMPSFSRTNGNQFVTEFQKVDARVCQAKPYIAMDISSWKSLFCFPSRSIVKSCLATIVRCTREHTGTSMFSAYEAVVNDCLLELKLHRPTTKREPRSNIRVTEPPLPQIKDPKKPKPPAPEDKEELKPPTVHAEPIAVSAPIPNEGAGEEAKPATAHVETTTISVPSEKKKKKQNKAKSAAKSQQEIQAPSATKKLPLQAAAVAETSPDGKIHVSAATARVFSILFDKSLSRSGLHWASFEAAMAELEFRITPRQGSSVLFEPPASLGLGRSLTIHRPHGSRVEGFRTVVLRQRLTRTFGWDDDTFVVR